MNSKTQEVVRILPKKLLVLSLNSINKLSVFFVSLKISPNALSVIALLFGFGAGVLFAVTRPLWAAILIIICGLLDVLDGKVAERTHRESIFGAIFDSTLDRYSEFFIYLGLAFHFRHHWAMWITFWTLLGSTMVSYTRARAEGLGVECKIGVMQRAERMVFLSLGSFVGVFFKIFDPVMIGILLFIAIVSNFTAIQRTFFVKKVERQRKLEKEAKENEQD